MASSTSKFGIQYPIAADPVKDVPTIQAAAAARVDLLLGEAGVLTIPTITANTTGSQAVTFARSYTGIVGVGSMVFTQLVASLSAATTLNLWVTSVTGTGFTLNWQSNAAQTNRQVAWRFLPCLP